MLPTWADPIKQAAPDSINADGVFKILRAWGTASASAGLLKEHRNLIKRTVIRRIGKGIKLTSVGVSSARELRNASYQRVRPFMETCESMIMPINQVSSFDTTSEYPTKINGLRIETYIDWMKHCHYIRSLSLPAAPIPCGFNPEGLPIGVQIVGRHHDDFGVLQVGSAF